MLTLMGLALAAAAPGAPPPADTVVGRWKTETRGGIVDIQRCGPSICGRILTSETLRTQPDLKDSRNADKALRGRPIKGLLILTGFTPSGEMWDNGKIYNAEDGKTYKARITPASPDTLKLRGCVFVPFCKTQTWTRVR